MGMNHGHAQTGKGGSLLSQSGFKRNHRFAKAIEFPKQECVCVRHSTSAVHFIKILKEIKPRINHHVRGGEAY
jgi:hypothetical protein